MKSRINVILVVIVITLGSVIWVLVRDQKAASTITAGAPAIRIQVQTLPPAPLASSSNSAPAPTPRADATTIAKSNDRQKGAYMALDGDTLSNVAAGLFGSDSKKNRDAVIAANPSLAADPDRVVAGQTYYIALQNAAPAQSPEKSSTSAVAAQPEASDPAHSDSDRVLKYTAKPGDSVSALAAGLLGGDSKTNRDAIVGKNKSLQNDPDHVEVGKTYKIPTHDGLSAAPAPAVPGKARPTTQPDADELLVHAGRELRYTARKGDNVSKLAEVLLGSDTQENRDSIINTNASLKADPDRVVVGQVYWIPAPIAPIEKP